MKKGLLWIVAAVAAMVSCSEDDGPKISGREWRNLFVCEDCGKYISRK